MKYSQQVLDMLQQAVSGQIDNFWDFSFKFNALNDFELMMFLEEHDTSDKQGFINFLTPYYKKAKQLVNHSSQFILGVFTCKKHYGQGDRK